MLSKERPDGEARRRKISPVDLRLRSNKARRPFPRKPSGRRVFCPWPALAQSLQPAAGMRRPRRLGHSQNPSPQRLAEFSDRLLIRKEKTGSRNRSRFFLQFIPRLKRTWLSASSRGPKRGGHRDTRNEAPPRWRPDAADDPSNRPASASRRQPIRGSRQSIRNPGREQRSELRQSGPGADPRLRLRRWPQPARQAQDGKPSAHDIRNPWPANRRWPLVKLA